MPMSNWIEASAGKMEYVRVSDLDTEPNADDLESWLDLHQQYIDAFGHGEKYLRYLKLKDKIARLQLGYLHGKGFNITLIKVEEANLKELELQMQGGLTVYAAKVHLEKYIGRRIDLHIETVYEYHTILQEYAKNRKG